MVRLKRCYQWLVLAAAPAVNPCEVPPPPQGWTVPVELADDDAISRLSDWNALPVIPAASRYVQQTSRQRGPDTSSAVFAVNGNRDFNNFICQGERSTLDPLQSEPFHFDQARCEESYVRGAVIARFVGSGRWVRSWMAIDSARENPVDREILRVYVDDDPKPRVEVALAQALDGRAGELFAPPFGAGSWHRFAWYYPTVFGSKLIVAVDGLGPIDSYYTQNDAVLDAVPQNRKAAAASVALRSQARAQLDLSVRPSQPQAAEATHKIQLAPGGEQLLAQPGPATWQALRLRVAVSEIPKLHAVQLRGRWDSAAQPSFELPLLDLFSSSASPPERPSRALASRREGGERIYELRLPMPFATSAELTFRNQGTEPLGFAIELATTAGVPSAAFGKLNVQVLETLRPTFGDHTALRAAGRGRVVGMCTHAEGYADPAWGLFQHPFNFLEGDVRASLEGELALDGTGTEDYADDVFYFIDTPQGSAFAQAWGKIEDPFATPQGKIEFCHWHVLGTELDFQKSAELTIELGANNPRLFERIRTVSYYYLADP